MNLIKSTKIASFLVLILMTSCSDDFDKLKSFELDIYASSNSDFRSLQTNLEPIFTNTFICNKTGYWAKSRFNLLDTSINISIINNIDIKNLANNKNKSLTDRALETEFDKFKNSRWYEKLLKSKTNNFNHFYRELFLNKGNNIIIFSTHDFPTDSFKIIPEYKIVTDIDSLESAIKYFVCAKKIKGVKILYEPKLFHKIIKENKPIVERKEEAKKNPFKVKRKELLEIDDQLKSRIKENPDDWNLRYERALTQANLNILYLQKKWFKNARYARDNAKKFLTSAAKFALKNEDNKLLLDLIESRRDLEFKNIFKAHSARMKGTIFALKNNDEGLVDIPFGYLYRPSMSSKPVLYLLPSDTYERLGRNVDHFRITTNYRDDNGKIKFSLLLPYNDSYIADKDIELSRGDFVKKEYGNNNEWSVLIINDSDPNKNFIKLSLDIKFEKWTGVKTDTSSVN